MERRVWVGAAAGAAVLVVAAAGAIWWQQSSSSRADDQAARTEVQDFASAWQRRSFTAPGLRFDGATSATVASGFATTTSGLGTGPVSVRPGDVQRNGDEATSTVQVTWTLAGRVPWTYSTPVTVVRESSGWAVKVRTDHSLWHPNLAAKDRLTATRTWGTRGNLLDRSGTPLAPMGTVYPIQIDPARATPASVAALEKVTAEPAGSLVAKLAAAKKAGSQSPIPVITYRKADFDARRSTLDSLTGIVYPARQQPLAKTRTFAQPLLGSFGPVSAEQIAKGNGRYAAGDFAGTSGLQRQYDSILGGTPGLRVVSSAHPSTPLFEQAPVGGKDVKTTLDPKTQDAAEAALAGTGATPSAMVAIDVRTGDVLASANSPELSFDRAMTGHYPPGSSLKIVTTYALLGDHAVSLTTPATCPPTYVVDGHTYKNYEGESLGTPDFTQDFAHSCNTAFVQLAAKLGDSDLANAAKELGLTGWADTVGIDGVFDAHIPVNNGKTDKASGAIGQARDTVSPLALAVMAGNIARGSRIAPALVTDPAPSGANRTPVPLAADRIATLHSLMGAVVTQGTATVLLNTPGGTVYGKTGTAEFGNSNPPQTRCWFVGFQGNVAFAVLVEQGKSGGTVAAPIARAFLTRLAQP